MEGFKIYIPAQVSFTPSFQDAELGTEIHYLSQLMQNERCQMIISKVKCKKLTKARLTTVVTKTE